MKVSSILKFNWKFKSILAESDFVHLCDEVKKKFFVFAWHLILLLANYAYCRMRIDDVK